MKIEKKILTLIVIWMMAITSGSAQASTDFLRSTGKIYSVVGVIVLIFVGIVAFLWRLDNKLTKLENQINNEQ